MLQRFLATNLPNGRSSLAQVLTKFIRRTLDSDGEDVMIRKLLHLDFHKAPTEDGWRAKKRYFGDDPIGPRETGKKGGLYNINIYGSTD